jgi:hypothetical protein
MRKHFLLIATVFLISVPARPVWAQAPSELEALKAEIARLKAALQVVEARVGQMERGATPTEPSPDKTAQAPAGAGESRSQVAEFIRRRETVAGDVLAAARVDNLPVDPEMRGFMQLPGTDTVMRIGGYAKLDAMYDFKPAGDKDLFVTSTIPTGPTLGLDNFNLHIRQTRINLDLRRPVANDDLRIFVESDFFGARPNLFRMRHAYGQWRNLLVGQSFSTFMDVDALVETLDFEGPSNTVFVLQPQVRYTVPISRRQSVALAIEQPTTEVRSASIVVPRTPAPDGVVRWRYDHDRGHVQVATLLRSLAGYVGTEASATLFGWGLNLTGSLLVGDRDNVVFQGNYGRGVSRYVNDTAGLGLGAGIDNGRARALPLYGAYGGYQHFWTPQVRSTLTYGFLTLDNASTHGADVFHASRYFGGNVIFAPTPAFNIGAELIYGRQELKGGDTGNAARFQLSLQYDLVRR